MSHFFKTVFNEPICTGSPDRDGVLSVILFSSHEVFDLKIYDINYNGGSVEILTNFLSTLFLGYGT